MGLELLSISLGMCTFEQLLCGRRVVVHSDNSGSEWALRRGCARRWDHAQLVHQQWLHALKMRLALHVVRVDTHDNIADLPSRRVRARIEARERVSVIPLCVQEFNIFAAMDGEEMAPVLHAEFTDVTTWEMLTEHWAAVATHP